MSKKCTVCGAQLEDNAIYCDECGAEQVPMTEKEKLIADLERASQVARSIHSYESIQSRGYDELVDLQDKASGEDQRSVAGGCLLKIIGIAGAILCFKLFGKLVGVISIFVIYFVVKKIDDLILKIKNRGRKEEIEKAKQEYEARKGELEDDMKRRKDALEDLRNDVAYQKYSYLVKDGYMIPSSLIDALKEGKAETIEEAKKYINW